MGKAYLLTGEPRVVRTTALKEIIYGLGKERCGGFYTEALCVAGEKYGFRIMTLGGHFGMLADITYTNTPLKVGRYGVVLPFLENFALPAVYDALASKEFVVVDEMGPMQLFRDQVHAGNNERAREHASPFRNGLFRASSLVR